MITPAMLMRDTLSIAQQHFGPDVGIQFLDGDEPAAYFEHQPKLKVADTLIYNNHYIGYGIGQELIVTKLKG